MTHSLKSRFLSVLAAICLAAIFFPGSAKAADIDSGDSAWMSCAAALVMLMTPALGFFYAGLVRRKNLVSTLVQCLAIFALASLVWTLWGYSLAFGPSINGMVGNLSLSGLNGVGFAPNDYAPTIPALLYFFFQLKFAAITPALIIGAFAERINFRALLVFIVLWVTFIYAPAAHWVWGIGGWSRSMGVLDFAGGTVVHVAAGFSALAAALVIGKRKDAFNGEELKPNNIPYVVLGASLLWFGWFGFNAGSALAANGIAASALVVTNCAAAAAAMSWMFVDWARRGKPTAVGLSIGAVCGLVAITPASGFVGVIPSIIIGLAAGIISNFAANWRASRTKLDDSLDVFACHGLSGVWGAIAAGLFANTAVNAAGADGFFYGNPHQLLVQLTAVSAVAAYAFAGSYALLKLISLFVSIRVSFEDEEAGLDRALHGEEAYG